MILTICNDTIILTVDTFGAQMMSLRSEDGTEYIWQGDPEFWADRALNLFPFIGRLWNGTCKVHGMEYPMNIHGFACRSEFCCAEQSDTRLVLELEDNEETLRQYPFHFLFRISYELEEKTVKVTFSVKNSSQEIMPFAVGGHPGFRVPLNEGENFEDYTLVFSEPCQPDRVGFSKDVYLNGKDEEYPLWNGCEIPLRHSLFDEDAIILKNMAPAVTLSGKNGRGVMVSYPFMPYLGLWHWPEKDAPYVCIEPWSSLPSRHGTVEELTCKSDMLRLQPNGVYENSWTIRIF